MPDVSSIWLSAGIDGLGLRLGQAVPRAASLAEDTIMRQSIHLPGLLFCVLITGVITDAIKDAVGQPRPDFFWCCSLMVDGKRKMRFSVILVGLSSVGVRWWRWSVPWKTTTEDDKTSQRFSQVMRSVSLICALCAQQRSC
ncbi:hypothetical protein Bca52824_018350 [Brassica carinata]|uniref:Uncharacterized protein n=1 Tax=Brassica carinata TaxID=52824 RepID=A0A8X7VNR1_BRACI|nr:hypothetical protein Bca52824_018350 [Brassica carinata]